MLVAIYDRMLIELYANTTSDIARHIPKTLLVILCVTKNTIMAITSSGTISSIAMNSLIRPCRVVAALPPERCRRLHWRDQYLVEGALDDVFGNHRPSLSDLDEGCVPAAGGVGSLNGEEVFWSGHCNPEITIVPTR